MLNNNFKNLNVIKIKAYLSRKISIPASGYSELVTRTLNLVDDIFESSTLDGHRSSRTK